MCNKSKSKIYKLSFKYSRDDTNVFSKNTITDIILSKTVADDLLQCENIKKWCLLKLTGRKAFENGSHCSKF